MEVLKQDKKELADLKSYDEISDFIEKNGPISKEDLRYLNQNLMKIMKSNEGYINDNSIIRFFINIEKVLPYTHHVIYLLLQLDDEKNIRKLIEMKREKLITILEYAFISPATIEDYQPDLEEIPHTFLPTIHNSTIDDYLNTLVLYTDYSKKNVVLAFIEELLPYLCPPNFNLELNLVFLLKNKNSIIQYMNNYLNQGKKQPLSLLWQVVVNHSSLLFSHIMGNIENIEFYMTGEETITPIQMIFKHYVMEKLTESQKKTIKRKNCRCHHTKQRIYDFKKYRQNRYN